MKQAWGNITDATQVGLARINSDYKDLDIAIVKATNHVEAPPKEKHVRTVFAYTAASRPRADVAYCIHQIGKRLSKTHDWLVAVKCLMVIHRTLREGDPTFREELVNYHGRGRVLNLANFKDESGPAAWDYSAWVRTYALFLEEKLDCFRVLGYDVESEKSSGHSRTRELGTPELLEQLPALQSLLHRLMGCQPEGAAVGSHVIQAALGLVLKESFKLYRAINDGIINLVDKFFDMNKVDAAKALSIYKRAGEQAEQLSQFYDMCKSLDLARSFQFPTLEQPPASFLVTMEDYVREAPKNALSKDSSVSADEGSRRTGSSERRERKERSYQQQQQQQQQPPPPPVQEQPPPQPAAPQPPPPPQDLLLDVSDGPPPPQPDATQLEQQNALALAIVPEASAAPTFQANTANGAAAATTGWELALVTAPSATAAAPTGATPDLQATNKLAGGLDKLTLDSLYEDALRRSTNYSAGYATSGPVGAAAAPGATPVLALPAPPGAFGVPQQPFGAPHDPFSASMVVPPPPNVQMAAMAQQQQQQFGGMPFGAGPYVPPPAFGAGGGLGMPGAGAPPPAAAANPFANPYGAPNPYGMPPAGAPGMAPGAAPYQSNPFAGPSANLL